MTCDPARDQGSQVTSAGGSSGDVGLPPNQTALLINGSRRASELPELRKNQTTCRKVRSNKNVLEGSGESWGNNGHHENKRSNEGCVHCA